MVPHSAHDKAAAHPVLRAWPAICGPPCRRCCLSWRLPSGPAGRLARRQAACSLRWA